MIVGSDVSSVHILSVVSDGSAVPVHSHWRHVLPALHFSPVLLLHGLAQGKMIMVFFSDVAQGLASSKDASI